MSNYDNLPPSKPAPRRSKNRPVFCVGWRAFINWPNRAGYERDPMPLLDLDGKPLHNDLADGQEVEILSWRPNSRRGPLYEVRRLGDDSKWWIDAVFLRNHREAAPPAAVVTGREQLV